MEIKNLTYQERFETIQNNFSNTRFGVYLKNEDNQYILRHSFQQENIHHTVAIMKVKDGFFGVVTLHDQNYESLFECEGTEIEAVIIAINLFIEVLPHLSGVNAKMSERRRQELIKEWAVK